MGIKENKTSLTFSRLFISLGVSCSRKIPALEWLARKLEDAVHSIGLCPGWSCCGHDGSSVSPEHPSLPVKANSRGGANQLHPACNRRQVVSQFRAPFRRLGPQSSASTFTTVNTSSVNHKYDGAAETLIINGTKASLVGIVSPAPDDSVVSDEPVTTIDDQTAFQSRSEWV